MPNIGFIAPSRPIANRVRENCSIVVSSVAMLDRITAHDASNPPVRPRPEATAML